MTSYESAPTSEDLDEGGPLASLPDPSTICYERTLGHPAARVWDAIVQEAELPRWFVPFPAHLELRVGGRWSMDEPQPSDNPTFRGTVVDYRPHRRIEMTWREGPSSMWFEVEPLDESTTRLRFGHRLNADDAIDTDNVNPGYGWDEQPCGPGTFQPGLAAAWHEHLERLRHYLDGSPVPPPGNATREVVDHYRRLIVERGARAN